MRMRRMREPAVIVRQAPGYRGDDGVWVAGSEERKDVKVVTAPASMAELREALPEGSRLQDARRFWVETDVQPLRVGEAATGSDLIEYQGTRYRVQHSQDWGPFDEVLAVRVEGQ